MLYRNKKLLFLGFAVWCLWWLTACHATSQAPPTAPSLTLIPPSPALPQKRKPELRERSLQYGQLLFYHHTQKGLYAFDFSVPKTPKIRAHIPLLGTPVRLLVHDHSLIVVMRGALQVEQDSASTRLVRRAGSQVLRFDLRPSSFLQLQQKLHIPGYLQDATLHKDGLLYMASIEPRGYQAGWQYLKARQEERVTLYALTLQQAGKLSIHRKQTITIAPPTPKRLQALSEASALEQASGRTRTTLRVQAALQPQGLHVVMQGTTLLLSERWQYTTQNARGVCGPQRRLHHTRVSVFDLHEAWGSIQRRLSFSYDGQLLHPDKQAYLPASRDKAATYVALVRREHQEASLCASVKSQHNTLTTFSVWPQQATHLKSLPFGDAEEQPNAMLLDTQRRIAYITTTGKSSPLYAIRLLPEGLQLAGVVDKVGRELQQLHLLNQGQHILRISRDTEGRCQGQGNWETSRILFQHFDLKQLSSIKRGESRCLSVRKDAWLAQRSYGALAPLKAPQYVSLHQHKGQVLLTAPLHYYTQEENTERRWNEHRSVIGLMRWGTELIDDDEPSLPKLHHAATLFHPHGHVSHTALFHTNEEKSQGGSRTLAINIADSHLSVVSFVEGEPTTLLSQLELSAHLKGLYPVGKHLLEFRVRHQGANAPSLFRLRERPKAGQAPSQTKILHAWEMGPVQQVLRWENKVLLFSPARVKDAEDGTPRYDENSSELRMYDFSGQRYTAPTLLRLPFALKITPQASAPSWQVGRVLSNQDKRLHTTLPTWQFTPQGIVLLQWDFENKRHYLVAIDLKSASLKRHLLPEASRYLGLLSVGAQQGVLLVSCNQAQERVQHQLQHWRASAQFVWKGSDLIAVPGLPLHVLSSKTTPRLVLAQSFEQLALASLDLTRATLQIEQQWQTNNNTIHSTVSTGTHLYVTTSTPTKGDTLHLLQLQEKPLTSLNAYTLNATHLRIRGLHNKQLVLSVHDTQQQAEGLLFLRVAPDLNPAFQHFVPTPHVQADLLLTEQELLLAEPTFGLLHHTL